MTDQPFILTKKEPGKELTALELADLFKISGGGRKKSDSGSETLTEDANGNPNVDD